MRKTGSRLSSVFRKHGNAVLEDNGLDEELRIYNPKAENALADMGFEV